jgi:hypothetical protein
MQIPHPSSFIIPFFSSTSQSHSPSHSSSRSWPVPHTASSSSTKLLQLQLPRLRLKHSEYQSSPNLRHRVWAFRLSLVTTTTTAAAAAVLSAARLPPFGGIRIPGYSVPAGFCLHWLLPCILKLAQGPLTFIPFHPPTHPPAAAPPRLPFPFVPSPSPPSAPQIP